MRLLSGLFDVLPDLAGILLAAISAAIVFVPGVSAYVVKHKRLAYAIAGILCLIGIGGVISNTNQKSQLTGQVNALVAAARIQATGDDIVRLGENIRSGFSRLEGAVERLEGAVRGKSVRPIPPPSVAQLPPPVVEHIRFTARRAPSNKPDLPYGLQVIIQTDTNIQPVSLTIECDGEIGDVSFFVAGQGVYFNTLTGIDGTRKNIAIVKFSFPSLTPEAPLVVTLLSKIDIHVTKLQRLPH